MRSIAIIMTFLFCVVSSLVALGLVPEMPQAGKALGVAPAAEAAHAVRPIGSHVVRLRVTQDVYPNPAALSPEEIYTPSRFGAGPSITPTSYGEGHGAPSNEAMAQEPSPDHRLAAKAASQRLISLAEAAIHRVAQDCETQHGVVVPGGRAVITAPAPGCLLV
ncbi:hypothetical protein GGQ74_000498 [Desulfobaculum xiamenense]|uniref:Uncharacterized protein n=1 Tax=Desulfobaculum xiamenense TaxID=995050 RepID=A0A846QES4_9BACT|nr:hypothetical protein [Desulfobaculum xiamenense]NJB66858.1 hypothetical protein [Desulfobaculum xiamenense]